MAKPNLKLVPPPIDILQVPRTTPTRKPNASYRQREHLVPQEVDALIEGAKQGRHGFRDATMILVCFRHGFRAAELVDLRWSAIDFTGAKMHIRRVKRGTPSTHPILGDELRALRRLRRENPQSEFVFLSERGGPFSTAGFARLVQRGATAAGLGHLKIHPHALRHSTGYALINNGADLRSLQSFLGHASPVHTCRYAQLSSAAFDKFWRS
jgi:integrase